MQFVYSIFHFLSYLTPSELPRIVFFPKVIFGSVGLFFLFFIMYCLFTTTWLKFLFFTDAREFLTFRAFGVARLTKKWGTIVARLETANESEYKLAVIEADSMLDDAMKRLGFVGATIGEKLKTISPTVLPSVQELAQAHEVRNSIVRDPNYVLSFDQAKKTMAIYEKSFKYLDLI